MSKKQTRRGVHFRRAFYEAIRLFCAANDLAITELVERAVCGEIGMAMPVAPRNVTRDAQLGAHARIAMLRRRRGRDRLPAVFHRLSHEEVSKALSAGGTR